MDETVSLKDVLSSATEYFLSVHWSRIETSPLEIGWLWGEEGLQFFFKFLMIDKLFMTK